MPLIQTAIKEEHLTGAPQKLFLLLLLFKAIVSHFLFSFFS